MSEVYFACQNVPFLYDIETGRLYKLVADHRLQIDSHLIIHNVRFHSTEISQDAALRLLRGSGAAGNPC